MALSEIPPIRTETIVDPDDPRIAAYRDIKERDLAGRTGRFVAEGKVVLNVLLESRFKAESILILENRLAGLLPLLQNAPASLPIYIARRNVMDAVAGFPVHRGILAIGKRQDDHSAEDLLGRLGREATIVALIGISNHDNIGAIFRNAAAFDASAVLLDSTCCDPLYRKAIRVSVGAVLKVPFARVDNGFQMMKLLHAQQFEALALTPGAGKEITEIPHPGRLALMLGTEGTGLPADILQQARSARISMSAGLDSLNVATAGAIALHHFYKSDDAANR